MNGEVRAGGSVKLDRQFPWVVALLAGLAISLQAAAEEDAVGDGEGAYLSANDRVHVVDEGFRATGMYAGRSFAVYVPENWVPSDTGGRLSLEIETSGLLTNANVTVTLNQVTLGTVPLEAGRRSSPLVLDVPSRAVVPGWNVLRLQFYLRASDDPCQDIDNPGLWAWIGAGSFLALPHTLKPVQPDLSLFPGSYSFCDAGGGTPGRPLITFLLPEKGESKLLEIAVVLAARFGAARLCAPGRIRAWFLDQPVQNLEGTHLVVLGTPDQVSEARAWGLPVKEILERMERLRQDHPQRETFGMLLESVNPRDTFRRLLVATGSGGEGLSLLREHLGDASALTRLAGAGALFLAAPILEEADPGDPSRITFAALKHDDIVLRGVTSTSYTFSIPVPRHWRLDENAHLHLHLRYPISFKRSSTLEVSLNGVPAWSREFVPDLGTLETRELEADVPVPALPPGTGALRVGFNLRIDVGSDDCARPYDDSLWVVVGKDSFVSLSHRTEEYLSLGAYPDLFVRGARLERVGFVLDRSSGSSGLTALLNAASALGARAGLPGDVALKAVWANDFERVPDQEKRARAWIVIDSGRIEPVLRPLAARAPLPLDDGGRVATEVKIRYAIPENVANAALWQVCRSPWKSVQPVLLVSAERPEAIAGSPLGAVWGDSRLHGNAAMFFPVNAGEDGFDDSPVKVLSLDVPTEAPGDISGPPRPHHDSRWIWLLASCMAFVLAVLFLRRLLPRMRS